MAISYRPSTALHDQLRAESERTGRSIQQLLDDAVTEHFDRQSATYSSVAAGIVGNNRELFDRLADL